MSTGKIYRYLAVLDHREVRIILRSVKKKEEKTFLQSFIQGKHVNVSNQDISRMIFDDRDGNGQKLAKLKNRLIDRFEGFFLNRKLEDNPLLSQGLLLEEMSSRGLHHDIKLRLKRQAINCLQPPLNELRYYESYRAGWIGLDTEFSSDNRNPDPIVLEHTLGKLELYYLLEWLKLCCSGVNLNHIGEKTFDVPHLKTNLSKLAQYSGKEYPLHTVYLAILKCCLQRENKDVFYTAKELFVEYAHKFSIREKREVFLHLMNHCYFHINHFGDAEMQNEAIILTEMGIRKGFAFEGDKLEPRDLTNFVSLLCGAGKLERAKAILKDFGHSAEEGALGLAVAFCKGTIAYYSNSIETAQSILHNICDKSSDKYYSLASRLLLWRTYISQEDWKALFRFEDSYRQYFKRVKGVSEENKALHKKLIGVSISLAKSLQNPDQKAKKNKLEKLYIKMGNWGFHPLILDLRAKIEEVLGEWEAPTQGDV